MICKSSCYQSVMISYCSWFNLFPWSAGTGPCDNRERIRQTSWKFTIMIVCSMMPWKCDSQWACSFWYKVWPFSLP